MELSAVTGAAAFVHSSNESVSEPGKDGWRKSLQPLLPCRTADLREEPQRYRAYPYHTIGTDKIFSDYDLLADWMISQKAVMMDGYVGIDWVSLRTSLAAVFAKKQVRVTWYETAAFQFPEEVIEKKVQPFLGEHGSVWGTKTSLTLEDFYDKKALQQLRPDTGSDLTILIGYGAAFAEWDALIYADIPKNEIQYRMRAGSVTNLGSSVRAGNAEMYKRFYFVDWVVCNRHRQTIADRIRVIADGQWKDTIHWALADAVYSGLAQMSRDVIRVRPWFEAGAWGGQWMKKHIPEINRHEVNYAWSFELIAPENGIVLESSGLLLEISFDWLMERQGPSVLGANAAQFGTAFPIRFDFLDTFDGGNLSIQCHPSRDYIRTHFGEPFTQDETYYILDCTDDAGVYLGFQEDIDPASFRKELETSVASGEPVEIEKYVQKLPAHKHDLFLIPNQTIHSAGKNNLVLEISATPYIFTFKMYDWVRLDLHGKPRPINIEHAFRNLDFSRKGQKVQDELISKPRVLEQQPGFKRVHLPTHAGHFYDVHRYEFINQVAISTHNQCHVLMLVEGESVIVETAAGKKTFYYAETFVIPAAAGSYQLINPSNNEIKVLKAFLK